eukprot:4634129-Prorocentrum_lima.AAC.1
MLQCSVPCGSCWHQCGLGGVGLLCALAVYMRPRRSREGLAHSMRVMGESPSGPSDLYGRCASSAV